MYRVHCLCIDLSFCLSLYLHLIFDVFYFYFGYFHVQLRDCMLVKGFDTFSVLDEATLDNLNNAL